MAEHGQSPLPSEHQPLKGKENLLTVIHREIIEKQSIREIKESELVLKRGGGFWFFQL